MVENVEPWELLASFLPRVGEYRRTRSPAIRFRSGMGLMRPSWIVPSEVVSRCN